MVIEKKKVEDLKAADYNPSLEKIEERLIKKYGK